MRIVKSILKRPVYLALFVAVLAAVPCASAATINTATIVMPSSEWEARFLGIVGEMKIAEHANPAFKATENRDRDPAFRFEHMLDLNKFIKVAYYDDGKGAFNSAVLTINLDGVRATDPVWLAIIAATIAGDPNATVDMVVELMNAICPALEDVLTGKERLKGTQAATLHGVGYVMELNEDGRFARFFTNAAITQN